MSKDNKPVFLASNIIYSTEYTLNISSSDFCLSQVRKYPKKQKRSILTQALASFKALTIAVSIHRQSTSGARAMPRHRTVTIPKYVSLTFTNRQPFGPLSNDCKKHMVLNQNGIKNSNLNIIQSLELYMQRCTIVIMQPAYYATIVRPNQVKNHFVKKCTPAYLLICQNIFEANLYQFKQMPKKYIHPP